MTTTTTETRVRRLRRALAREGMGLTRRGKGYMVFVLDGNAVVGGGRPVPYFLDLDAAEGYVAWFDQPGCPPAG